MIICLAPMFIFQEVIKIPILLNIFGVILFSSAALMSIGVIKIFSLSFEVSVSKRFLRKGKK
jgi:hypothetical protein